MLGHRKDGYGVLVREMKKTMVHCSPAEIDCRSARGRKIVEADMAAGRLPPYEQTSQRDNADVLIYRDRERERVEKNGECSAGCRWTQLQQHRFTGRVVCPRTAACCPLEKGVDDGEASIR